MSYAIRKDGKGWRAVNGPEDIGPDEIFSVEQPLPAGSVLDDLKAAKLVEINLEAQRIATILTAGYPEFEKATWPDQQRESLAWEADTATPTPYLDQLATYRGIDRILYIQKTLTKVKGFRAAAVYLAGTRQKYEDQVKAANTPAQVAAIQPAFNLPS